MRLMSFGGPIALVLALAAPAAAQYDQRSGTGANRAAVTPAVFLCFLVLVFVACNEVYRLRSSDQATVVRLQARLDDARDEVVYLRVKLRKEGSVTRDDYDDVRGQIESVRNEASTRERKGNRSKK